MSYDVLINSFISYYGVIVILVVTMSVWSAVANRRDAEDFTPAMKFWGIFLGLLVVLAPFVLTAHLAAWVWKDYLFVGS